MRRTTPEFPGEPMVLHTSNGGIEVSIPIRIRRYSGRRQVVVPQGIASACEETRADGFADCSGPRSPLVAAD